VSGRRTVEESKVQDTRGGPVSSDTCQWRRSGIFKSASDSDIAAIGRFKKDHLQVPGGRTLVRRDTRQTAFYTLSQGWAYRFTSIDGGRQIFHFCLPGDLIAIQAPLLGKISYSVQTLTDASLCVFDCGEIETLFDNFPRLGLAIARLVAAEGTLMEVHLATVGRRSAEARVAYILAELYTRLKHRDMVTENTCVLPLTQEHLADALGLSTVHVSRMLRVLSDDGLAKLDRGRLTILDFAGLCARAEIEGELTFAEPPLF
jgi:CRP/FNR family transcriptional regulator